MSEQHTEEAFIKTPQQLIVVVVLAFVVPIVAIMLLIQFIVARPTANQSALAPEAVAARIRPVGKIEFGAPSGEAGARSGEEIVKASCMACHGAGVAGAPKLGDKAAWAPRIGAGLQSMLTAAIKGKNAMPAKGGASDLSDYEVARAVVYLANQSGGSLKEPAAPKAAAKARK